MPEGRPDIPTELQRAVMVEAGHRCAIPTCRAVRPLVIEHIDDWAKVKEHEFSNLIVLCANCHGLKGAGPRSLDRKALRQYKANLGVLTGRYSDLERRVLDYFAAVPDEDIVWLPAASHLMVMYLVNDGYLTAGDPPFFGGASQTYYLTDTGRALVTRMANAEPLD